MILRDSILVSRLILTALPEEELITVPGRSFMYQDLGSRFIVFDYSFSTAIVLAPIQIISDLIPRSMSVC